MMARKYDGMLFLAVLCLVGFGVVMVYSTSSYYAQIRYDDGVLLLKRQGVFALLGLVAMSVFMMVDYRLLRKFVYVIFGLCVLMLCLVWAPGLGKSAGGSLRWLNLGLFTVQPSEAAKLGMVIYLSHIMVKKRDRMHTFSHGFVPPLMVSCVMVLLVFMQPDFGTAVTLLILAMMMLLVGGARPAHLVGTGLAAAPLLYIGLMGAQYRRERILAFLDPWSKPMSKGFQIIQSFLAFGNGGISGRGLGMSHQKLFYLPMAHNDFILSVVGEELGLIGVIAVVAAFVILLARGLKIAADAPDSFGSNMAAGITLMIAIQAIINMGVVMGLLPTKGLPLPFISYGGSSLVVSLTAAGILLNISAAAREKSQWTWAK